MECVKINAEPNKNSQSCMEQSNPIENKKVIIHENGNAKMISCKSNGICKENCDEETILGLSADVSRDDKHSFFSCSSQKHLSSDEFNLFRCGLTSLIIKVPSSRNLIVSSSQNQSRRKNNESSSQDSFLKIDSNDLLHSEVLLKTEPVEYEEMCLSERLCFNGSQKGESPKDTKMFNKNEIPKEKKDEQIEKNRNFYSGLLDLVGEKIPLPCALIFIDGSTTNSSHRASQHAGSATASGTLESVHKSTPSVQAKEPALIQEDTCSSTSPPEYTKEMEARDDVTDGTLSCTECGKLLQGPTMLQLHMQTHRHFGSLRAEVRERTSKRKTVPSSSSPAVCTEESSTKDNVPTGEKSTLKAKQHIPLAAHSCTECGKHLRGPKMLLLHMRIHTGARPYVCEECNATFRMAGTFKRHVMAHSRQSPYTCNECGKTVKQLNTLRIHMRAHLGERRYVCDLCGKAYVRSTSLKVHKRTHTGQRSFICEKCGKAYAHAEGLRRHILTHEVQRPLHMCKDCGKSFTQADSLRKHIRLHTGERPYVCEVCGLGYIESNSLKIHKLSHTGERPFECHICKKTFTSKSCLKSHMRVHPGQTM